VSGAPSTVSCGHRAARPRRAPAVALLVALAALAAPAGAAALPMRTCRSDSDFVCGALTVPIDHSGRVGGTLKLAVAAQRHYRKGAGLLIALSGGPGQSSVDVAGSFAQSLAPMLRRYRLVVLDQRGTGLSGALRCPQLQATGALDPFTPQAILRCEQEIGPRRSFYGTPDTVGDLNSLRVAFGAHKIALMGVSYGTWVAQEYARTFPSRTDRLILDSVVGPDRPDAFFMDSYSALPRILREQCAGRRCKGVTKDPVRDLAAVLARVRRGPISGTVYDTQGRRRTARYTTEEELSFLVTSADLNPFMQARLPGAMAAARAGDMAALLHLRRIGEGPPTKTTDLSLGLNVTTGCLDTALPWPADSDPAVRPALALAALAAIPPASYAPWSAETVRSSSYADDCLLFPRQAAPLPPLGRLPDVPALVLGGRLDMRTPVENAEATAKLMPRAQLIEIPGDGHDQLDSDGTGCAERALRTWADGGKVKPCRTGETNELRVLPIPPHSIEDFRRPASVPGDRGRTLFATLDSVDDARISALEALYAGFSPKSGGLHGGSVSATDAFNGTMHLRSYTYVPGVHLTGALRVDGTRVTGTVRVTGAVAGTLTLRGGGASGVLGGRTVRYSPGGAAAAAGAQGSRRRDGAGMPRIPAALLERGTAERWISASASR